MIRTVRLECQPLGVAMLSKGSAGQTLRVVCESGFALKRRRYSMRILVFCDEDLSVAAGGTRQVLEFAQALSRRLHTIRIVAPRPTQGHQLAQEFAELSFRPVSVWRVAGLRPFSFLIASWNVLRQELSAWRPDVLLWFDSPG